MEDHRWPDNKGTFDHQPKDPPTSGKTLCCETGASGRTAYQCATCAGPVSLGCLELWHVARCETLSECGRRCNVLYSTKWGCFKHPYRHGHNPEMKEYSDSLIVIDPNAPPKPALFDVVGCYGPRPPVQPEVVIKWKPWDREKQKGKNWSQMEGSYDSSATPAEPQPASKDAK